MYRHCGRRWEPDGKKEKEGVDYCWEEARGITSAYSGQKRTRLGGVSEEATLRMKKKRLLCSSRGDCRFRDPGGRGERHSLHSKVTAAGSREAQLAVDLEQTGRKVPGRVPSENALAPSQVTIVLALAFPLTRPRVAGQECELALREQWPS